MATLVLNTEDLERTIRERIGRRVHGLTIETRSDCIVLRGQAISYHVKQLAQHGLADLLPDGVRLENAISVIQPEKPRRLPR